MVRVISHTSTRKPLVSAGMTSLLAVAVCLSGCTTSLSVHEDTATTSHASAGLPYQLPEKEAVLEITWTLTSCSPVSVVNDGVESTLSNFDITATSSLKTAIVEGPTLVIDYMNMTNRFKSGNFTADYYVGEDQIPTRIIKSINAEIKGEEPAALKSAISAAGKVAKIVLGIPPVAPGGSINGGDREKPDSWSCKKDTQAAIDALAVHEKANEVDEKASKKLSERIAILLSRAINGKLLPNDEKEVDEINRETDTLAINIGIRNEAIKALKNRLSYTERFEPDLANDCEKEFSVNSKRLTAWIDELFVSSRASTARPPDLNSFKVMFKAKAVARKELAGADRSTDGAAEILERRQKGGGRSWPGYLYRDPVNVRVIVEVGANAKTIYDKVERIPQRGNLRLLPLRSRWGEHNSLIASFAPDGVPTKVEYKTPSASGAAMMDVLDSAAGSGLEIAGLIAGKKAAKEAKENGVAAAALADLKVQVDTLEQRKKLLELENGLPADVTALNAELSVLRLQKERADLNAAIRNAQKND